MPITAAELQRELGERFGDYIEATPTSPGTTASLVDAKLRQYWPYDLDPFFPWVYCSDSADIPNRGVERRGERWSASARALYLSADLPTAPTSGVYEIHLKYNRKRKLEALNEAIGNLNLWYFRPVVDESIQIVKDQFKYQLPAGTLWDYVGQIHLEVDSDDTMVGYPYRSSDPWNASVTMARSATGQETWWLQFVQMPPIGHKIRLYAEAGYSDLVNDDDVLPLGGPWERAARGYIFNYALYLLNAWDAQRQPANQGDRPRVLSMTALEKARQDIIERAPTMRHSSRIIVPGRGTGMFDDTPSDPATNEYYFGAFHS